MASRPPSASPMRAPAMPNKVPQMTIGAIGANKKPRSAARMDLSRQALFNSRLIISRRTSFLEPGLAMARARCREARKIAARRRRFVYLGRCHGRPPPRSALAGAAVPTGLGGGDRRLERPDQARQHPDRPHEGERLQG